MHFFIHIYTFFITLAVGVMTAMELFRRYCFGTKRRLGLKQRFGFFDSNVVKTFKSSPVIWVHAVSLGETRAAAPLLKALKRDYPEAILLLSNVTETGHMTAESLAWVDECVYAPYDLPWVVKRFFRQVNPRMLILMESEIWPNVLKAASNYNIPALLVNGRVSDRTFRRYQKIKGLMFPVLNHMACCCMQSDTDAQRLRGLGLPDSSVFVSGNMKYDVPASDIPTESCMDIRKRMNIPVMAKVLTAGSTHDGEEETLISIYKSLVNTYDRLALVIVPRHPGRCPEIEEYIRQAGFNPCLRSRIDTRDEFRLGDDILLVDTMGEMLAFYGLADIVFVGGSLVPHGGHNLIEAAIMKKPALFGPHMHNFKDMALLFESTGAGSRCGDSGDLKDILNDLLEHHDKAEAMGTKGFELIQRHAGATEKTMAHINRFM